MTFFTLLSTGLTFFFVLPYLILTIIIPGLALTRNSRLSHLERLAVAPIAGFCIFTLTTYIVRFFNLPFAVAELGLIVFTISQIRHSTFPQQLLFKFSLNHPFISLIIIMLALIHSLVLIRSGVYTPSGFSFVDLSFHDSTQHLSLIKRLWHSNQIIHPGYSGTRLTNYHYLIDLSLAAISRFSYLSLYDIYYRIYPVSISISFSLITLAFLKRFTASTQIATLGLIFTLLAGNASFFLQFRRGPEFSWGSNTFIINPLIDILQNPASIFVLAQLLASILLLEHYSSLTHSSIRKNSLILMIIISSPMIGFKAWGGLLITFGLFTAGIYQLVIRKDWRVLNAALFSCLISALIFLPHFQPSTSASPVWAPGWSLERLMNDADRWNRIETIWQRDFYLQTHDYPRLLFLYSKWTAIYIFGNYWLRIVGLVTILYWTITFWKRTLGQITIIAITFPSLVLPLLFNQGRMAYDIEQFSPYALLLASVVTIIVLNRIFSQLSKSYYSLFASALFLLIICCSVPSNFTSIQARAVGPTTTIPFSYFTAYTQVERLTPSNAVILLSPSHRNRSTLRFAAFTGRDTFVSGRTLSIIAGTDYDARDQLIGRFFSFASPQEQRQLILDYHITHLFLYQEDRHQYRPDPATVKLLFENEAGTLYQYCYITPEC